MNPGSRPTHTRWREHLSVNASTVLLRDPPNGDEPESYFGSFGQCCGAGERGVILVTEMRDR
jgi:hypothetical protein